MGSEWRETTLGAVVELKRGYDLPKRKRLPGTIPLISSSGVSDTHSDAMVKGPGVVTGRYGTIGEVFFSQEDFWPLNTTLYVRDFKGNDEKFVYYFLKTVDYLQYSDKAAVPGVNRNHLHTAEVCLPTSIGEQKAIAHILGTLDDKIELNRQMNATLEAMAQTLFKSWFVDFDPVIDNALTAGHPIPEPLHVRAEARKALGEQRKSLPEAIQKQFPNRFVFNEDMGWVPEGWEVGTLLDHSEIISGGTPKTSNNEYWDGGIPWASAKDISQCGKAILLKTERTITRAGLEYSSTKLVGKHSTVIVSRGATTGRLAMVGGDFAMNQTCYALRSKFQAHFYQYCKTLDVISALVNAAHGSIFDTITTTTFRSTLALLPPVELAGKFDNLASTYFSKLHMGLKQSSELSKLRDTLLPKLLSGQLRIPDAEKQVAEAI